MAREPSDYRPANGGHAHGGHADGGQTRITFGVDGAWSNDSELGFGGSSDEDGAPVDTKDQQPADVFFHVDIYDAVLVAAFGGVSMNLDGTDELHVHPAWLFIFCVPLVFVQAWLTFCVGFDLSLSTPVHQGSSEEAVVISMKLILIVVVQLMFFDRLLSTLRCFFFSLNPTTWTDVKRIDPEDPGVVHSRCAWLHWSGFVAPFPIIALALKLGIEYWVGAQSTSIILGSPNIKEAIFDSLAISFIIELDGAMWKLAATVLHLDRFDDFGFQLWPTWRRQKAAEASLLPRIAPFFKFLHRGFGARRLENIVTSVVMVVLYMRQLFVVLHALDTGILPVARDICTFWRWETGQGQNLLYMGLFRILSQTSALFTWSIQDELARKADPAKGGMCTTRMDRLQNVEIWRLVKEYPWAVTAVSLAAASLLVVPQLFYSTGAIQKAIERLDFGGLVQQRDLGDHHAPSALAVGNSKRIRNLHGAVVQEFAEMRARLHELERRLADAGPAESGSARSKGLDASPSWSAVSTAPSPSQQWHPTGGMQLALLQPEPYREPYRSPAPAWPSPPPPY